MHNNFLDDISLTNIADSIRNKLCLQDVAGVSYYPCEMSYAIGTIPSGSDDDTLVTPTSDRDYLYFQAEEYNATITMWCPSSTNFQVSTDGVNWNAWKKCEPDSTSTFLKPIKLLCRGDYVFIRATTTNTWTGKTSESATPAVQFSTLSKKVRCGGNVMSLLSSTISTTAIPSGKTYFFSGLFKGCINLTSAPELPSTSVTTGCYRSMFDGCVNLLTPPSLPSSSTANYCYQYMFRNCISMTSAPALTATSLSTSCYHGMFENCASLTAASTFSATSAAPSCCRSMFSGCTSLTTMPSLASVALAVSDEYCYADMFSGCTSLVSGLSLNATDSTYLPKGCYMNMFKGCVLFNQNSVSVYGKGNEESFMGMFEGCAALVKIGVFSNDWTYGGESDVILKSTFESMYSGCTNLSDISGVSIPILRQNKIGDRCFYKMFYNCSSLPSAFVFRYADDELSVNTAISVCSCMYMGCTSITSVGSGDISYHFCGQYCCEDMFRDCTALVTGPISLPSTELHEYCYSGMFRNCISLTSTPELPATTLAEGCYADMFNGCSSITESPRLDATSLATDCYVRMFYNCTSLVRVICLIQVPNTAYTQDWMYNVAATGMFFKNALNTSWTRDEHGIPLGWNVSDFYDYFNLRAVGNVAASYTILVTGNINNSSLQYVASETMPDDNTTWNNVNLSGNTSIYCAAGKVMYFRSATGLSYGTSNYVRFNCNKDFVCGGNIMTLIDYTNAGSAQMPAYGFYRLFYGQSKLTNVPDLPATTIGQYCYAQMFRSCTSLYYAKQLPATTLATGCYSGMFYGCTNIYSTSQNAGAYPNGCSPATLLPAANMATDCYKQMFYGCTNRKASINLPSTSLAPGCYEEMFVNNTSAYAQFPDLPALTLASNCYKGMFEGCTNMVTPPEINAVTLASNCCQNMFIFCSSLEVMPELKATTLEEYCYSHMFEACTSLVETSHLPAATLNLGCYEYMFYNCQNLSKIYCKTDYSWLGNPPPTEYWVFGVAQSGDFYGSENAAWDTGDDGIPYNWNYITTEVLNFTSEDGFYFRFLYCFCEWNSNDIPDDYTPTYTLEYSFDGEHWDRLPWTYDSFYESGGTVYGYVCTEELSVHAGEKLYLRGDGFGVHLRNVENCETNGDIYPGFKFTQSTFTLAICDDDPTIVIDHNTYVSVSCHGDVTSLLNGVGGDADLTSSLYEYSTVSGGTENANFMCLFNGQSLLTLPSLPSTTLSNNCYSYMFYNCSSFTKALELPATTLARDCYTFMFSSCNDLISPMDYLPASNLEYKCYFYMFENCANLTETPNIMADSVSGNNEMSYMFMDCTSLNTVKIGVSNWSNSSFSGWLSNVASSGTFYKLTTTTVPTGSSGIPSGWTAADYYSL